MNKSYSKIRHIQESNQKLEKGLVSEQETPTQKIGNNIATEGLKNVTPEMIAQPPFTGQLFGYSFGGVFNNVEYSWNGSGVEGLPGIRGISKGLIISEKNSQLSHQTKKQVTDADPNGVFIGYVSDNGYPRFVVYMTKDKKPKALQF